MALIFPFNFNPVATLARDNSSYTVSAGRYSLISYSLSANANNDAGASSSQAASGQFWAAEGAVITINRNTASAGNTAVATISVDGTIVGSVFADVSSSGSVSNRVSNVSYAVSEFNITNP